MLDALELHLGEIAKTGEKLANYHELTRKLDRQNEILRDALNAPDHPLITMQDKWVSPSTAEFNWQWVLLAGYLNRVN